MNTGLGGEFGAGHVLPFFLPPIHIMLLGLCLSTAMTLDAPCGTEPLLLLPQRLAPGMVPESELGHCVFAGVVFRTGVQENRPPHA